MCSIWQLGLVLVCAAGFFPQFARSQQTPDFVITPTSVTIIGTDVKTDEKFLKEFSAPETKKVLSAAAVTLDMPKAVGIIQALPNTAEWMKSNENFSQEIQMEPGMALCQVNLDDLSTKPPRRNQKGAPTFVIEANRTAFRISGIAPSGSTPSEILALYTFVKVPQEKYSKLARDRRCQRLPEKKWLVVARCKARDCTEGAFRTPVVGARFVEARLLQLKKALGRAKTELLAKNSAEKRVRTLEASTKGDVGEQLRIARVDLDGHKTLWEDRCKYAKQYMKEVIGEMPSLRFREDYSYTFDKNRIDIEKTHNPRGICNFKVAP